MANEIVPLTGPIVDLVEEGKLTRITIEVGENRYSPLITTAGSKMQGLKIGGTATVHVTDGGSTVTGVSGPGIAEMVPAEVV